MAGGGVVVEQDAASVSASKTTSAEVTGWPFDHFHFGLSWMV